MFQGTACTLEQVLQSRTDRQDRQQALLKKGCSCLLSFGLNVPGAVKQSPALRQVFDEGLSQLRQLLSGALGEESVRHSVTGSEALMEVRLPAGAVKQKTVMLEELHPLGRLFDMDVLDGSGRSLSRRDFGLPARRCLLCGGTPRPVAAAGPTTGPPSPAPCCLSGCALPGRGRKPPCSGPPAG